MSKPVLMLRSFDQLQEGETYNLPDEMARELIEQGKAIVVIGPDEIQQIGPTEIKPAAPRGIKRKKKS